MPRLRETDSQSAALAPLRRRWFGVAMASVLIHLLACAALRPVWPSAGRWGLAVWPGLVGCLWLLWRGLPQNRRPGETALLPTLGSGTAVTLIRGLVLAMVTGFLFVPRPDGRLIWLPALLYSAAAGADYLDGYLARRTGHTTVLGALLDLELDAAGILVACLLAVRYELLPPGYLVVGLARYLFVVGTWLRRRRGAPVFALEPSKRRRLFAGFQMGFLSATLWPIVPNHAVLLAAPLFAGPVLLGFLRDWWVVSGRLDPTASGYLRVYEPVSRAFFAYAPWGLRAALVVSVLLLAQGERELLRPSGWEAVLSSWGVAWPSAAVPVLAAVALACTICILMGVAGRLAALLLALPLCVELGTYGSQGFQWWGALALVCDVGVLLLGKGATWRNRPSLGPAADDSS